MPEFLEYLSDASLFTRAETLELCARLIRLESLLDVKLARQLPRYGSDDSLLDPEFVVAFLDILDRISPGGRLIPVVSHLTQHANERIRSRAALLLGRRIRNPRWVERHLNAEDARFRANVVESLWGVETVDAREILQDCLADPNNRVVANALIGLHMLGDRRAAACVTRMLRDDRAAFRRSAAWAMGKMGLPEFEDLLRATLNDPDEEVRSTVERALEVFRKPQPAESPIEVPAPDTQEQALEPAIPGTAPRFEYDLPTFVRGRL
ncbi:MAG: HEAT repeat domain-containing protein [Bryobacteraceae bacterium]